MRRQPISVLARRGALTESVHLVHAVAVRDGRVVEHAGDPELITFMRSSAKPIQALPLVRARADLDDIEVAIACASHLAAREQLEAVRSLLARADAAEEDLECGPEGIPPARSKHNCSGKHAGMLALAHARRWPRAGYRLPDHPVQREMLNEVAQATGLAPSRIATAVDGCGVVTFALPLSRMAGAFARLQSLEAGDRVATAMRTHPELIRGPGAADTLLMQTLPGWVAKAGAEGLLCAVAPDGLAVALKVADGNGRAVKPALAAFVERLGYALREFARVPVTNSRGEAVGELVCPEV